MKILLVVSAVVCLAVASIYPEGETKEEWDARINAKIDKRHKRDVTFKIPLSEKLRGQNLRLRVDHTRQTFPMGN